MIIRVLWWFFCSEFLFPFGWLFYVCAWSDSYAEAEKWLIAFHLNIFYLCTSRVKMATSWRALLVCLLVWRSSEWVIYILDYTKESISQIVSRDCNKPDRKVNRNLFYSMHYTLFYTSLQANNIYYFKSLSYKKLYFAFCFVMSFLNRNFAPNKRTFKKCYHVFIYARNQPVRPLKTK